MPLLIELEFLMNPLAQICWEEKTGTFSGKLTGFFFIFIVVRYLRYNVFVLCVSEISLRFSLEYNLFSKCLPKF